MTQDDNFGSGDEPAPDPSLTPVPPLAETPVPALPPDFGEHLLSAVYAIRMAFAKEGQTADLEGVRIVIQVPTEKMKWVLTKALKIATTPERSAKGHIVWHGRHHTDYLDHAVVLNIPVVPVVVMRAAR